MRNVQRQLIGLVASAALLGVSAVQAQDWPQWRGTNRDGKVTGFTAPKTWPKELKEKWKVAVGDGVATPALVGDKLYVFTRQGADEILRCLNVADGTEVWKAKYASAGWSGIDASFQGPRSSPAVADGKVVTLGATGILSCFDAAKGTQLWQKNDFKGARPMFHVASSPMIVNGLAIAQLGGGGGGGRGGKPGGGAAGGSSGAIVAYDLATGDQKWKWTGPSPAYGSPTLLTIGDTKAVVAETASTAVAVNAADGKLLWEFTFQSQYNSASPLVDGQTVILSGKGRAGPAPGTKAIKLAKEGDKVSAKELWSRERSSVQFSTPILKDGIVYGVSASDYLFSLKADSGETVWTNWLDPGAARPGYGSVVDAGSVLFALNPSGQLIAFEPNAKEFKELAKYKVANGGTYAYPIISGKRIIVKDSDSVKLFTLE